MGRAFGCSRLGGVEGVRGGDHGIFVQGWVWVDLVRDTRGEVYVQGREGVCKLGIDLIDANMKDGM